jgi:hydroxyacylglutathione hydrolase
LKIERFEVPGLAQYSYIVSSQGEAVVVDAIRDTDRYCRYLAQQGLRLRFILETHIHADFAAGSKALAEETGAELALSAYDEGEHHQYSMPHRRLQNGDRLNVGSLIMEALHTPGHTPERLAFVLFDTARSGTEPMALFSGDFLFVGSLGRPDLLGEQAKHALAHELFRSLHQRIAALADGVQLYPGHGAGSLCGAGMSEQPESTLGFERRTNTLFALDEQHFVHEILSTVPPMPKYYPRMKTLNAAGATAVSASQAGTALTVREAERLLRDPDTVVLDLRRPESFGGAHISGAVNIGAGQNLSLWAGWMLAAEARILLVRDEEDYEQAHRALSRVGLDAIGHLQGGMAAWIDAGLEFSRLTQLSADEVRHREPGTTLLDVRSEREWADGHIEGAKHIMLGDLPELQRDIPRDQQIIAVCGSGYRSSIASSILKRLGFPNVSSMSGGMGAWNRKNLPLSAV